MRKAILIESSNVNGERDLPGARVDVSNWKTFLSSDLGGEWTDAEIKILRKPSSIEVENELKLAASGYSFIVFSGHGSEGSVALNDWIKYFPINSLMPKGEKGTLIIDSCRGPKSRSMESFQDGSNAMVTMNRQFKEAVASTKYLFAAAWNKSLIQSSSGLVQMLSCSKGQSAGEDPSAGGYYTSLLMLAAAEWNQRTATSKTYTTKDAHDYAAGKLPSQQKPEYKPLHLTFPFAVKL